MLRKATFFPLAAFDDAAGTHVTGGDGDDGISEAGSSTVSADDIEALEDPEAVAAADAAAQEEDELARVLRESEEDARRDNDRRMEAEAREAEDAKIAIKLSAVEASRAEAEALARAETDLQVALEASKEVRRGHHLTAAPVEPSVELCVKLSGAAVRPQSQAEASYPRGRSRACPR